MQIFRTIFLLSLLWLNQDIFLSVPHKIIGIELLEEVWRIIVMQPITFFEIASQHANWLSERQKVVSENIANASTPGYRSKDISAFETVLNDNIAGSNS